METQDIVSVKSNNEEEILDEIEKIGFIEEKQHNRKIVSMTIQKYLTDHDGIYISFIENQNQKIAYQLVGQDNGRLISEGIYVVKERRRKNIGTMLKEQQINFLEETDSTSLLTPVKDHGFIECLKRKGYGFIDDIDGYTTFKQKELKSTKIFDYKLLLPYNRVVEKFWNS